MTGTANKLEPRRSGKASSCSVVVWRASRVAYRQVPILLFVVLTIVLLSFSSPVRAVTLQEAHELYYAGKYDKCLEQTGEVIELGVYNENWWLLQIRCQMETGRHAAALQTLDAGLKKFSSSVKLRYAGIAVCRMNGDADRAQTLITEIDERARQTPWRYTDSASRVTLGRYYLDQGADARQVLEVFYDAAKKQYSPHVDAFTASAELALLKHDYAVAVNELTKAIKIEPTNPQLHYLMAVALAPSDGETAAAELETALELNPRHVDSMLFKADRLVDAEQYDEAAAWLAAVEAVNPEHPLLWSYHAVLAHLENDLAHEQNCREVALSWWESNPAVDHLIGQKLSQKYRFAEAADYQRRALTLDPDFLPAKLQLCQDLLRLGQEEEGWRLANEVRERDGYNVMAHNLVALHDDLAKFSTLEADGFVLRMEAREAQIYGRQALGLLREARRVLCAKYEMQLHEPIIVEIFPRQADFAIRTFGLPGGAGFLGVCFGQVVTMNSPASQGNSPANWQAVLWHEFCHVVTLQKTNNKMPRWLSEGISVYEERQRDSSWGQSLDPTYRAMILGGELTPVSQLSAAFLRPASPLHLQFAYFESSLVVEYLINEYGLDVLRRVLVDLSIGMPINESLARYVGSMERLDAEFADHARKLAENLAPQADWESPNFSARPSREEIVEYLESHPDNFAALRNLAEIQLFAEQWDEALKTVRRLMELYPEYADAHQMAAAIHRQRDDATAEREALQRLVKLRADAGEPLLRLLQLQRDAGDWQALLATAERLLAVNPLIKPPHECRALAAEQLDQDQHAIEAYRCLLELDPADPAESHYRLAVRLHRSGQPDEALRQVLMSLEEAPRYRAAHQLLLEIAHPESKTVEATDVTQ